MKQFTIGVFGDDKWCHQFVKKIFKEKKIKQLTKKKYQKVFRIIKKEKRVTKLLIGVKNRLKFIIS